MARNGHHRRRFLEVGWRQDASTSRRKSSVRDEIRRVSRRKTSVVGFHCILAKHESRSVLLHESFLTTFAGRRIEDSDSHDGARSLPATVHVIVPCALQIDTITSYLPGLPRQRAQSQAVQ